MATERPSSTGSNAGERIRQVTAKNVQRLGYRRIVQLLVYLVIIPTVLLLAIGIFLLFLEGRINLLFGILTVSFVSVVITGIVLVIVFLRREANLSELQADFVSKVSHELRTPLTAIRLFAETLERPDADRALREKVTGRLIAEADRLSKMIERLLDWGRMEAGRKVYDLHVEEVGRVLEDAIRGYAPYRELAAELDFAMAIAPDVPPIVVDRAAVADAIVNLLSNAQKYGGSPPRVLLAVTAEKDLVRIAVSDNGSGIPRPEHRRIFQKFYRVDDRLSRTKEGSGLGLAIVNHVARAHHARVHLDSEAGKGSTFALLFPAAPPELRRRVGSSATSSALPATPASR